ncbi:MAG: 2-phosphosulfolactate phosphatase [Acidimicrobiales bacterium]
MHLEWNLAGLREGGRQADVVVVVDVLSFSTAVAVAVERGVEVYPYRVNDDYAVRVAEQLGAVLARPRPAEVSLSPVSLARLEAGTRVVLPSPNGATLALEAASSGATVVAGCLRNASAVSRFLTAQQRRVVVVAAGERWRDGTFRVAVEDLLGAGAVLAGVPGADLSAEATVAVNAFRSSRPDLEAVLRSCTSGRELSAVGSTEDVLWAAALDASPVVPALRDGRFVCL